MNFQQVFKYCPKCGADHFVINNKKSMRCEKCAFVFYLNPSAACAAFILNNDKDLLVCRRKNEPAKGTLDLPGGFTDNNESVEQALVREIKEELNGNVKSARYLFSLPNDYLYSDMNIPTLDMFFECQLEDTKHLSPADDVEDCFFIPVREINPALFGLNSVREAVRKFIALIPFEEKRKLMG